MNLPQTKSAKANKIIYWIFTLWISLGMISSGIMQIMGIKEQAELFTKLGFPLYFMMGLGVAKLLAAIVVLIPKFPLLKEWAYAGLTFAMAGAVGAHIATGGPLMEAFPAFLSLVIIGISWYFRPADRRVMVGQDK